MKCLLWWTGMDVVSFSFIASLGSLIKVFWCKKSYQCSLIGCTYLVLFSDLSRSSEGAFLRGLPLLINISYYSWEKATYCWPFTWRDSGRSICSFNTVKMSTFRQLDVEGGQILTSCPQLLCPPPFLYQKICCMYGEGGLSLVLHTYLLSTSLQIGHT